MSESDLVKRLRGPAAKAVQLLVNGCFRNDPRPIFHIPAKETDPDLYASASIRDAADEITRLSARVKDLEKLLAPFAQESFSSGPQHEFVTVKRSHCDTAAAALNTTPMEKPE